MSKITPFQFRVLEAVRQIPRGMTASYGQVAKAAGAPGASRAVGSLMKANHDPSVPCHRVVRSDGKLGEYNREGGTATKENILKREGAITPEGRLINWQD